MSAAPEYHPINVPTKEGLPRKRKKVTENLLTIAKQVVSGGKKLPATEIYSLSAPTKTGMIIISIGDSESTTPSPATITLLNTKIDICVYGKDNQKQFQRQLILRSIPGKGIFFGAPIKATETMAPVKFIPLKNIPAATLDEMQTFLDAATNAMTLLATQPPKPRRGK